MPLSLLLCFHPLLICLVFLGSRSLIPFAHCLFSDSIGGLAIYLLRRQPRILFHCSRMLCPELFLFFSCSFFPCPGVYQYRLGPLARTIASHHTHHFCAIANLFSPCLSPSRCVWCDIGFPMPILDLVVSPFHHPSSALGADHPF